MTKKTIQTGTTDSKYAYNVFRLKKKDPEEICLELPDKSGLPDPEGGFPQLGYTTWNDFSYASCFF